MHNIDTLLANKAPWAIPSDEVILLLDSSITVGLTDTEVQSRRLSHGLNTVTDTNKTGPWQILGRQFQSPLIFILIFAVFATIILAEYIDAFVIALAILVNTILGFYQEYRAERAVEHLRSFITVRTRVIRNGREQEIDARDVVMGDIIHLTMGSRVPADGRLISEQGLRIDEAVLTGESVPEDKSIDIVPVDTVLADRTNMTYGGTLVTEGTGLMVVTAVGMQTEFGEIASLVVGTDSERTPLQKAVSQLAWVIAAVISVLVVAVFILGIARGETMFDMFMISVAVAVGAIPEALPIGLTAVLAVGVERLARRKGIMRNLSAAETLGSTTIVMTDKTGTLTEAKLRLTSIFSRGDLLSIDIHADNKISPNSDYDNILSLAMMATDVVIENPDDAPECWRVVGNPLEVAVFKEAALRGLSMNKIKEAVRVVQFSSHHKFSVTRAAISIEESEANDIVPTNIIVGAPDILLERSDITPEEKNKLTERLNTLGHAGYRLVAVATQLASPEVQSCTPEDIQAITFVGVIAFVDPVRIGVPEAISAIERFGVRVIVATGDMPGTAIAVARELGWSVTDGEVMTGAQLVELDDEALAVAIRRVKIFARVTPADKLRIAQALQVQKEVVAMTGDGVNDAPSLKAVDIGIAVGSGSDVAKGVSDLILLDDNFKTIVAAIEEGKRVLMNIRKTFVYLMSNSLDEVVLISGSLLAGLALPLSAMQIIWVNFFTGSVPAIAYAFDNQPLGKRQQKTREHIINPFVRRLIISVGLSVSTLLFALYYILTSTDLPQDEVRTFIFICFASYILVVAFSFRELERPLFTYNPFTNQLLNAGVVIGLCATVATIYVPMMQGVFSTVPLPMWWWTYVLLWLVSIVALVEFCKFATRFITEMLSKQSSVQ